MLSWRCRCRTLYQYHVNRKFVEFKTDVVKVTERDFDMLKVHKKTVGYVAMIAVFISIAYICDIVDNMVEDAVLQAFFLAIRNTIHISLLIIWCVSLHRRILNTQVRRCMVSTGLLMAFWLTAKIIKYDFVASQLYVLGRYIWYSYYIPMIFIPLLGVFIIKHIGKPEGYRTPKWMNILYLPAFCIILGIFTNDLHRQAFDFP